MKFGFVVPVGSAREIMAAAQLAEASGWDGLFVWEPVWGRDAWVQMTAAAVATEKLILGTLLSPLSRMRPWDVAGKSATLDELSNGRLVISVGLGAPDTGFENFGEATDIVTRAELLDESLDIITGLWKGPFAYEGKHYSITETDFPHRPPVPVNAGRVPIWCVGLWNNPRSMARAIKYQGILPSVRADDGGWRKLTTEDVAGIRAFAGDDIDIIVEGPEGEGSAAASKEWEDAGATWYIESLWGQQMEPDIQSRVERTLPAGPPR